MHIHQHLYKPTCTHTHTHTLTHRHIRAHIYTLTHIQSHTHTDAHTHRCESTHANRSVRQITHYNHFMRFVCEDRPGLPAGPIGPKQNKPEINQRILLRWMQVLPECNSHASSSSSSSSSSLHFQDKDQYFCLFNAYFVKPGRTESKYHYSTNTNPVTVHSQVDG